LQMSLRRIGEAVKKPAIDQSVIVREAICQMRVAWWMVVMMFPGRECDSVSSECVWDFDGWVWSGGGAEFGESDGCRRNAGARVGV
jgi:hypothetical protein